MWQKTIRVQGAGKGAALGHCRVIETKNDLREFRKGEIVVSSSDNFELIFPLLRRAKGLILKDGSLISHIVILAREWKKPCVVRAGKMVLFRRHQEVYLDGTKGIIYFR